MELFNCRLVRATKPHFFVQILLVVKNWLDIVLYLGKTSLNETLRLLIKFVVSEARVEHAAKLTGKKFFLRTVSTKLYCYVELILRGRRKKIMRLSQVQSCYQKYSLIALKLKFTKLWFSQFISWIWPKNFNKKIFLVKNQEETENTWI